MLLYLDTFSFSTQSLSTISLNGSDLVILLDAHFYRYDIFCTPPEVYHGYGKDLWGMSSLSILSMSIVIYVVVWAKLRNTGVSRNALHCKCLQIFSRPRGRATLVSIDFLHNGSNYRWMAIDNGSVHASSNHFRFARYVLHRLSRSINTKSNQNFILKSKTVKR